MEGFQARNPNFYVFNAVLHLDESTPHLHINYIPVGHFTRGLEVRNAKNKAMEEMGFEMMRKRMTVGDAMSGIF